jgi:capsular polysaccharide export protein
MPAATRAGVPQALAGPEGGYRYTVTARDIGLWRNAGLRPFFGQALSVALPHSGRSTDIHVGWGRKPSGLRASKASRASGRPCYLLEDGFLRSCGLGVNGARPLSLLVDDLGVYYDASQPSRLEALIAAVAMTPELEDQAGRAIALIKRHRLSKYNHAPAHTLPALATPLRARVLVVDQTLGDVSVQLGGAGPDHFRQMLAQALAENPDAEIWIKTHPDVVSGKKRGYLTAAAQGARPSRVHWLARDVCPLSLLEQMDKVYTVTSQMGFEALLLDKAVVCFGQPWYAGWGLTDDRHAAMPALRQRRKQPRSLVQLFTAAYLQYARYLRPDTNEPGTIFDVIEWLARNKAANEATRGTLLCVGMSLWKRAIVRPFLASPANQVHFLASAGALRRRQPTPDDKIVIWGVKHEAAVAAIAAARGLPVWRMEDGFLRSVGLGSDLFRPVSLVLDQGGMYFDPASGSDLETMLERQQLSQQELARAQRFLQAYVRMRVSKYNLEASGLTVPASGRRVLLVPGQVEDDASVMRGSPAIQTNLALLQTVRAANPDAYILYKAHPDVVAGNRHGAIAEADLRALADQCVAEANIIECIAAADEVHTMTSLSGFEALLHGRTVHCYGAPFYAGWGLTVDHLPVPQRRRRLRLDDLVFAAMLSYPRYVLPGSPGLVSAEAVMDALALQSRQRKDSAPGPAWHGWALRKSRKAVALLQLLRHELGAR